MSMEPQHSDDDDMVDDDDASNYYTFNLVSTMTFNIYIIHRLCLALFNPVKCSGVRQLHLKV